MLDPNEKKRRQLERRQIKYDEQHKIINNIVYKRCNRHKELFPNEDEWIPLTKEYFNSNKSNEIDGYFPYCKRCNVKKAQKWCKDNEEQYRDYYHEYRKLNKRKGANAIKKWKDNNQQHIKEYEKEYQQKHLEKFIEYNHNRRHKNHIINNKEWDKCKKYFNYECAYCGLPIEEHLVKFKGKIINSDFHKEHVDCNGDNDLSNCVPSCRSCNSQKWINNMEEWYKRQEFFNQERLDKIHKWVDEDYKQYIIIKNFKI